MSFVDDRLKLEIEVKNALELADCGENVSSNCPSACAQRSKDEHGNCFWEKSCRKGLLDTLHELKESFIVDAILYASECGDEEN